MILQRRIVWTFMSALATGAFLANMALPAQAEGVQVRDAEYTLDALSSRDLVIGGIDSVKSLTRNGTPNFDIEDGVQIATFKGDRTVIVDASLVAHGALAVVDTEQVDLSWEGVDATRRYAVFRDNELLAETSERSFRDSNTSPGAIYHYRVETVVPEGTALPTSEDATIHGFDVIVPDSPDLMAEAAEYNTKIKAMAARKGSTVRYRTFIPQAKLSAPLVGCGSYRSLSGHKFGGDNRGYNASYGTSRTSMTANVRWDGRGLVSSSNKVGATKVYSSKGKLVATKTASAKDMSIKQLGKTKSAVDLRFRLKAGNPFCKHNSIQGAFTITITKNGSYRIISGSHRQMPNHEVYVSSTTGKWKTVYKRKYASAACLVRWACPEAQMVGYGSY